MRGLLVGVLIASSVAAAEPPLPPPPTCGVQVYMEPGLYAEVSSHSSSGELFLLPLGLDIHDCMPVRLRFGGTFFASQAGGAGFGGETEVSMPIAGYEFGIHTTIERAAFHRTLFTAGVRIHSGYVWAELGGLHLTENSDYMRNGANGVMLGAGVQGYPGKLFGTVGVVVLGVLFVATIAALGGG